MAERDIGFNLGVAAAVGQLLATAKDYEQMSAQKLLECDQLQRHRTSLYRVALRQEAENYSTQAQLLRGQAGIIEAMIDKSHGTR